MSIGITEDHRALQQSIKGWAEREGFRRLARAVADGASDASWGSSIADQGLLGLAVAEEYGGSGATPVELAVAIEEVSRTLGPLMFLPTVLVSLIVSKCGSTEVAKTWLPRLVDGSATATVELLAGGGAFGAGEAQLLLLRDDSGMWCLVEATEVEVSPGPVLDPTRPVGHLTLRSGAVVHPLPELDSRLVIGLARTLAAAEACGLAGWALDTTVAYVSMREQFGRPLGSFQAVKHQCADMLIATDKARAAAWDAARAVDEPEFELAAAVAGVVAIDAAVSCTKSAVQLHGGIGYSWEHDAHLYFKRAQALRAALGGSTSAAITVTERALGGMARTLAIDLGPEADEVRAEVRKVAIELDGLDPGSRRRLLADRGYVVPHWPPPYGRGASPLEQLVIEEEFEGLGVEIPSLVIGNWAAATILAGGTEEQHRRFVGPTLRGEISWCQMFSEPGAGSDLANLSTKATPTEGGFLLTGQKIWTSMARTADWAICLVRTDFAAVPKHKGITFVLVDMSSPGLDIRPLREMTGEAMFNEIFLNDVFVPDDCVVGTVNDGWRLTVTALANERVAMGGGLAMGRGSEAILATLRSHPELATDRAIQFRAGLLLASGQADGLLGLRSTLRRLVGTDPGPGASLRKLSHAIQIQDCAELVLELVGPYAGADAADAMREVLTSRHLTIAGGASEVQRNIIAERILGLPREK